MWMKSEKELNFEPAAFNNLLILDDVILYGYFCSVILKNIKILGEGKKYRVIVCIGCSFILFLVQF